MLIFDDLLKNRGICFVIKGTRINYFQEMITSFIHCGVLLRVSLPPPSDIPYLSSLLSAVSCELVLASSFPCATKVS